MEHNLNISVISSEHTTLPRERPEGHRKFGLPMLASFLV